MSGQDAKALVDLRRDYLASPLTWRRGSVSFMPLAGGTKPIELRRKNNAPSECLLST